MTLPVLVAAASLSACGASHALADVLHMFAEMRPVNQSASQQQGLMASTGGSGTSAAAAAEAARNLSDSADQAVADSICSLAKDVAGGRGPTTNSEWLARIHADLERRGFDPDVIKDRLQQVENVDLSRALSGGAASEYADAC